jgi:helicase
MPPVTKVGDQNELVPTKNFPYAKFPFSHFNPVQSRVFDYYDKDTSALIAANTSAGKTCVSEMFISEEIRNRKGKCIYLVPFRALAQERIEDWTDKNHHFSDLNISICTGDYRLTEKRKAELEKADLIIMTSEMLSSRIRNIDSEKSTFLQAIKVLITDEFHLVQDASRGSHLEVGLMKFTEINPNARLIMLSATMPNVEEIAEWVSYVLTKRDTFLLKSTYRPCPLNVHYEKYPDGSSYDDNELEKVNLALDIVQYYPEDKFLIFTHTKRTGELMKKSLLSAKIQCEFHNADLTKDKRIKLEKNFKDKSGIRVIVSTSTLSAGINMPARRVIVLGVHRGLEEVSSLDIIQECGRAGRPAYDPIGDAYVLLPEQHFDEQKERVRKPPPIQSRLLDNAAADHQTPKYKNLAFHLVSEIHQGNIKDKDDVHHWFKRSLAYFQSNELDESVVDDTLLLLKRWGAIWEEEGKYTVTSVGKIASWFYYSPFDVADLKRNFTDLFDGNYQEDDYRLSLALANVDTQRDGIVSRADRDVMLDYARKVQSFMLPEAVVKTGFAYHQMMQGRVPPVMAGFVRGLQHDFPRMNQVIQTIDGFTKWNKKDWLRQLYYRVLYGVKGPMAVLCEIPDVGRVRCTKLWNAGLKSIQEVADNPGLVHACVGKKDLADKIVLGAKALLFTS